MSKKLYMIFFVLLMIGTASAQVLNPSEGGFDGKTRSENYDQLLDAMLSNNKVVTAIGDKMWVPWYSTSSSCEVPDLQSGNACDAFVDETHNCMVTDEFSQVGVLVSMGRDQQSMDEFYNTLSAIKSTNGDLPAWRVYRNGNSIEACKDNINGNCDTASDASARIIISLFTAANNPEFSDSARQKYADKGAKLSADMLEFEVDKTCRPTRFGEVCNWLAAGSNAKRGGLESTDYGYTGYYPDAIIAMLMACSQTGNSAYCDAADDFALNYLQASNFDGNSFSAPPGRSFKWVNSNGEPKAECTNTCYPVEWDGADAPRALGICSANYYAGLMGHDIPHLDGYCQIWEDKYMSDPARAPLQYTPDGQAKNYQSGYFAQGLQSLMLIGGDRLDTFRQALDNSLSHYSPQSRTWDNSACFGVYTQAFPMRGLGTAIGRDMAVFGDVQFTPQPVPETTPQTDTTDQPDQTPPVSLSEGWSIEDLEASCNVNNKDCTVISDTTEGVCRTLELDSFKGYIRVFSCVKENNNVEMYTQEAPRNANFEVCLNEGCVGKDNGFARFKPQVAEPQPTSEPVQEPTSEPVQQPTSEPAQQPTSEPAQQPAPTSFIAELPEFCEVEGQPCTKVYDATEGDCRKIKYMSQKGDVDLMACVKDSNYIEMYRKSYPNTEFQSCVGDGCIDYYTGFKRFKVTDSSFSYTPAETTQTTETVVETTYSRVADLPVTCSVADTYCNKVSDNTDGSCRSLEFDSGKGTVKVLTCEKESGIEVYRQQAPEGYFSVCVDYACVNELQGFARLS